VDSSFFKNLLDFNISTELELCRLMNTTKKVAFYTLGCKLNFLQKPLGYCHEHLKRLSYARVDFQDRPDHLSSNTCFQVTENARQKCKQLVKQAKKLSPDSLCAIIGCYAPI